MRELSQKRAICAMPIAGSYRSIDFTLSNMTNSHIQKVAVFTQYNARSLNEHLNSSKWWDFGRKQGGLYVFTPAVTAENSNWYRGTADAIYQNLSFLKNSHEPYVVIASGDCVYKLDYNKVLEYHIEKKADITVVCRDMEAGTNVEGFGTIRMNVESRIEEFEEKPLQAKTNTISCGIYVVRRRLLIEMIEKCAEEDRYDFVRDILIRYKDLNRIYGLLEKYRIGRRLLQYQHGFPESRCEKLLLQTVSGCIFQGRRSAPRKIQSRFPGAQQPGIQRMYREWCGREFRYFQKELYWQ